MRHGRNYLFADGDLSATLRANQGQTSSTVDQIPKDQLLATPLEDLVEYVLDKLSVEPLMLQEEHMETTEGESKVDVSRDSSRYFSGDRTGPFYVAAHSIEISIPYSGDFNLWKLKPSSWKSVFPIGDVLPRRGNQPGILHLVFSRPVDNLDEERLGNDIKRDLDLIKFYVESSSSEVVGHNSAMEQHIRKAITSRKERIQKTEGIASRLGLPLKRDTNAPNVQAIKAPRKLVRPLPAASKGSYEPEYEIDDQTYEHILAVIRHEIATFEATPSTYQGLGEEYLRNILLAHLNGHYEGDATGETFRKNGKTDIKIEADNRAAFVAECKLWSGSAALLSAVDQLLGYLTWRDCKSSIIVFNKEAKNFTSILGKIPEALKEHQKFKRVISESANGEWRYCFQSANDELREVILHIFIADLYVTKNA
jgi:hypothetical protein